MPRKLKVYRTPIGFHDVYVAAASQKAALEAWGTDTNLFARGVAEEVTDPTEMTDALADPGTVIRKMRGTDEEHFAALPPDLPKRSRGGKGVATAKPKPPASSRPKLPPKPRPSRAALEAAETAIDVEDQRYADQQHEFTKRLAEIEEEQGRATRDHDRLAEQLEQARIKAETKYGTATREWRG